MTAAIAHRRGERGTTLIEVMIAAAVMLVAITGFVSVAVVAANSSRLAHRTTSLALLRSGVIDRFSVTPRASFQATNGWVTDRCWDVTAQLVATNSVPPSPGFDCPAGTIYKSWQNVASNGTASWSVGVVVGRLDGGCTPDVRYQSVACAAADLLLTD